MEIGIYTFGDVSPTLDGRAAVEGQRLRDLMEEVELADEVGLDVYGVGEHHRPDYAISAPAVVLAGSAEIMAGRGSFIESFPLFGYNLDDYDQLRGLGVYPRPIQQPLPVWIAVGGTP